MHVPNLFFKKPSKFDLLVQKIDAEILNIQASLEMHKKYNCKDELEIDKAQLNILNKIKMMTEE